MTDDTTITAEGTTTTEQNGVVYIPAYRAQYSNQYIQNLENDISAAKIFHLRGNVYASGVERKQKNLLFAEEPTIEVLDPSGEVDETLQTQLTRMMEAPGVDYKTDLMTAWSDVFWYGMAVFNWVWEKRGSEIRLTRLVKLPAHSFDTPKVPTALVYSQVLQGVTLPLDAMGRPILGGEIEFHQRQSVLTNQTTQLDSNNLFWVKDPSCDNLAGDPIVRPLIPVFEMLSFTWNAEMQHINRHGSKPLFIKITNPQAGNPANGNVGDVEYANMIISNTSKDTQYVLRSNMELIPWPSDSASDQNPAMEVIEALNWVIIDYMTPSSFVSKGGTLIGGSDKGVLDALHDYIHGVHRWLESEFNRILSRYLEVNGYEGYTARIKYPLRGEDKSDMMLQQVIAGVDRGLLDYNEARERLEAEGVDDATRDNILAFWQAHRPQPTFPTAFDTGSMKNTTASTPASSPVVDEARVKLQARRKKLAADILAALEAKKEA